MRFLNKLNAHRAQIAVMLATSALAGGLVPQASAQDGEAEGDVIVVTGELTRYSATKSDTPIEDTPRSITIETIDDLIERGGLNLADSYLYSAGVTGETYGFATRGDWVKVRGLDAPQYRDSLQNIFGSYNNTRTEIYTIEQVEILKGPSAVLYGQGSPGGIVNAVSKTPKDEFAGEVFGQVGSYDFTQFGFDLTGPLNESGSLLARMVALYRDKGTQVDYVEEQAWTLAPSLTWKPSDDTAITLIANFQDSADAAGAQFLPIYGTLLEAPNGERFDPNVFTGEPSWDHYDTQSTAYTVLAEHRVNDNLLLEATFRRTEGNSDYRQAWIAFSGGDRWWPGTTIDTTELPRSFYAAEGSSDQTAADIRARLNFTTGGLSHKVLVGGQYQDVTTETDYAYMWALGLYTPDFSGFVFDTTYWFDPFNPSYGAVPGQDLVDAYWVDAPASNTEDLGFYVHDQIEAGNWLFTLGARYDEVETDTGYATQSDDKVSLSAAAMYRFDNGVSPYVSYAESFEPIIGTTFSGAAFDPQEGVQYEIGLKYAPDGTDTLITIAYFDIEQSNLLSADPVNIGFNVQEGDVEISGIEFEGRWSWNALYFELNANQLETETSDGYQLASIPENQASGYVTWRPAGELDGFSIGGGFRYVGPSQDGADTLETPDYTLFDANIGYRVDDWFLSLSALNITDERYIATCLSRGDCFIGEDRTVTARVSRQF